MTSALGFWRRRKQHLNWSWAEKPRGWTWLLKPSTALPLPAGCHLAHMVMFSRPAHQWSLSVSQAFGCCASSKSSDLYSSVSPNFYFAKHGYHIHPPEWIFVSPLQHPSPSSQFTSPSSQLCPSQKVIILIPNLRLFAKPNYFLFKTHKVYDFPIIRRIIDQFLFWFGFLLVCFACLPQ